MAAGVNVIKARRPKIYVQGDEFSVPNTRRLLGLKRKKSLNMVKFGTVCGSSKITSHYSHTT